VSVLGALYGAVARRRRVRFDAPGARRRLARPVVSVGGLSVGGSGKTPVVATLAAALRDRGERPVILSRGYARRRVLDGVVVVSDAADVRAPVAVSGDEPQMLARQVPGVPVLVCPDRYLAGRLAERRFGATLHLLDDGFQHLALARDVEILVVDPRDLDDELLPFGRLREPLDAARAADAVVVPGTTAEAAEVAARLGVGQTFAATPGYGPLVAVTTGAAVPAEGAAVAAFAGIARPERFFEALGARGFDVVLTRAFRDHHAYRPADLRRLAAAARAAAAEALVTTAKDAVRLPPGGAGDLPVLYLPHRLAVGPAGALTAWLDERLAAARAPAVAGAA
jgi:tetraacyldisaccharide 4'-kinase